MSLDPNRVADGQRAVICGAIESELNEDAVVETLLNIMHYAGSMGYNYRAANALASIRFASSMNGE